MPNTFRQLQEFVATHTSDDLNNGQFGRERVNGCFIHYAPLHTVALDNCVACASVLLDGGAKMNIPTWVNLDYCGTVIDFNKWAEQFLVRREKIRQQTLTWSKCVCVRNVKRIIGGDMVREIAKLVWESRMVQINL